ncbi:MAG: AraC family transcriptional regulator [Spirochaetales bacterium]|nr:AraC family transcriptional regulator [Spirochaetales bacterium]
MLKTHRFFILSVTAFLILCLTTAGIVFYNTHSNRVRDLALESVMLLADWNKLQVETNQILMKRYTATGNTVPPEISSWSAHYRNFSESLHLFSQHRQIEKLENIPEEVQGIIRVWRYTEIQLNNADHYFHKIIQTGLGEKVMVNGFLHTMYKLRMSGQLTVSEIFLLDDTIYALECLNNATREFDILFTSVIENLKIEEDLYLQKVKIVSIGLSLAFILLLVLLILIQMQLKRNQTNRNLYQKNRRTELLKNLVHNSCEENLQLFGKRREELGIRLDLSAPVQPVCLQIDDYSDFSHQHNITEQEESISKMVRFLENRLRLSGRIYESFRYSEDSIIILINTQSTADNDVLKEELQLSHEQLKMEKGISVTMTFGFLNTEEVDLDQEIRRLLKLSRFRFLTGKGSFIYSGATRLMSREAFHYPAEKEKHFTEAMNSLDEPEALRILHEMTEYGYPFGPENMKRLIIRFTATLMTISEYLEKTYHITTMDTVTPMILKVQSLETLDEVKELLTSIIRDVIGECCRKKETRHDATVSQIKEIIDSELNDFNLSADSIADRFQLTSSYLNRLFKQHSTYSIAGYINHCRLNRAELLLRTTEIPVKEIAEQSGFASMGTFFRVFKKEYGRTPGDYQKESKQL